MEMPFFTPKDNFSIPAKKEEVTYWITKDRGINIIPSVLGMPDSFDATVFLYLLGKATKEWKKTGIFPEKVHFTLKELSEVLNTSNRPRLKVAIKRLTSTTYEFIKSFRKGGIYIDNVVRLLDKHSFWSKETELPKSKAKETTYIMFSKEIVDSIISGYYKYLDFSKHQKLKRPIARRLHFLLAKRLGENREIQIGFKKLAYAIPLQTYVKHKRKKTSLKYLFLALDELERADILTYEYDEEREIFTFRQPGAKLASMDAREEIKSYLISELRALWLPDSMINRLLDNKDWDLIAGALEYVDKQNPQNPTGFFLKILEDGSLPEALKKWSKDRTNKLISHSKSTLFEEDKEFVKEFLEEFKKRFPDLKKGFLASRFLRYKFQKAYKERRSEKEKERIDPKEVEKLMKKLKEEIS